MKPGVDSLTTAEERSTASNSLVNLAAETLFSLAARPEGASIRTVAQETGNGRSSTHRILQQLASTGYVQQTENGGYVVGPRLLTLSARVFGSVPILQIARSILKALSEDVGETCYLAVYNPGDHYCTYIQRHESSHLVRHVQQLGDRIPLHAGAVGKAILGALPDFDLSQLQLDTFTPHTLNTVESLSRNIQEGHAAGYSTSVEERVLGVAGVAAAVRSHDHVVGALTVSIPLSRVPTNGLSDIGNLVRSHAGELSSCLESLGINRI